MNLDGRVLNMAAAGLTLAAAVLSLLGGRRNGIARLSGLIGLIGAAAWATAAYQDIADDAVHV